MEKLRETATNAFGSLRNLKLAAPILLAMGCAEGRVGTLMDNNNETDFNVSVLSSEDRVDKVPYDVLELVVDDNIEADEFDGWDVGIFLNEDLGEEGWKFSKEDKKMEVTTEFWCDTALPSLNVLTHKFRETDECISDPDNCGEQDCSDEAVDDTYNSYFE